jgi:hypothetical protein
VRLRHVGRAQNLAGIALERLRAGSPKRGRTSLAPAIDVA